MGGYIYVIELKGGITKFGISTDITARMKNYNHVLVNIFSVFRLKTIEKAKEIEKILIYFYASKGTIVSGREYVYDLTYSVDEILVYLLEKTDTEYFELDMGNRKKPIINIEESAKYIARMAMDGSTQENELILKQKPIIDIKKWGIAVGKQAKLKEEL